MSHKKPPVPPPENPPKPKWQSDQKALAEVGNWDNEGILRGQEEKNHLLWLKLYGFVTLAFLGTFTLLFLGSLLSWSWHYMAPECCHWLTEQQLSKIQSVLFSGSIGGVVSLMAQKQLSK